MKNMMKIAFGIAFLPIQFANADAFEIGDRSIEIPNPEGLFRVQEGMQQFSLFEAIKKNLEKTEDNKLLALYFLENTLGEWAGHCQVQIHRKSINETWSRKEFSSLKNTLNKSLQENSGITQKIQNENTEPLGITKIFPPHYETDLTISYSSYLIDDGVQLSATHNIVNSSEKLLLLYCHAPQEDLQWTQNTVRSWGDVIVERNPSPPTKLIQVIKNISIATINSGVAGGASGLILGLLIGALYLLYLFFKRIIRKKQRREI